MIRLRVNGEESSVPAGSTLKDLIERLELDERYLVVEWNGEPRGRESFASTVLREGDRLELVRPVAGG
jgi:thiamine biosynthesis protein ThiS